MMEIKDRGSISHPFIHTASGKRWYVTNTTADMVDLESIAEGLSKEARFAGQTPGIFYSVAQHSVLATKEANRMFKDADPEFLLLVLLHDASEAYIGDQAKPIKMTLPDFNELEGRVQSVIESAFGVRNNPDYKKSIKGIDNRMVLTEAMQLFPSPPDWVSDYINAGIRPIEGMKIEPMEWKDARSEFFNLARLLLARIQFERSIGNVRNSC